MKTILGLDPGLATIGYGFIRIDPTGVVDPTLLRKGVIKTHAGDLMSDRLLMIQEKLTELVEELEPHAIAIENPMLIGNSNAPGVFQALGVIRIVLGGLEYKKPTLMTPNQMKKAVTGNGAADKDEVRVAIADIFRLPSSDGLDDVYDGIGVALAHALGVSAEEVTGGAHKKARRKSGVKKGAA